MKARAAHLRGIHLAGLLSRPPRIRGRLVEPPEDAVTLFRRLCQLGCAPVLSEKAEQLIAQEVVKRVPFIRPMNPLANRHHLVVAQLGGDDRTSQALLFLAPDAQRLGFLYSLSKGGLRIRLVGTRFMRRVGAVASFIFFPTAAWAGLVSSNVGHEIASGVRRSVKYAFVQ
jgi:hypothetical protein